MILLSRITLILVLLFSFSCNDVKSSIKTKDYKIKGLKSNFTLPERFENISGKDLILKLEKILGAPSQLARKKSEEFIHFIDYESNDLVMILPSSERLHIEKYFLNKYADIIEEGTIQNTGVDYEIIEKYFITSKIVNNDNKALKVKFKYKLESEERYFTNYLLTTKNESLSVSYYNSNEDYDLQDMIARYLNKN